MVMEETDEALQFADPTSPDREIGSAQIVGTSGMFISHEYNVALMGHNGLLTYDKMRKGDASVRSSLRVVKTPLLAAEWYFAPASSDARDIEIAAFAQWSWESMSRQPLGMLWEMLLMLDYGYYAFEKVYEPGRWSPPGVTTRTRNVAKWKKFGPRHPLNVTGWSWDANGGVTVMKYNKSPMGWDVVSIPIEKLLLFTLDEEAGNPEGISILRSAYKHWYMKDILYKIDAIQKERHGIGIPVAVLPPNATKADKTLALEMVTNLRTNEKAGVVLPSEDFILKFLELTGNPVDVMASANHHDMMIKENVLANFLNLGSSGTGSRAVGTVQEDIFIKSIHYLADYICGVMNKWAVPELIRFNYNTDRFPKMKVRRIGDTSDLRAFAVSMRNYVESHLITPDDVTENWIRDILDMPMASPAAMARSIDDRLAVKKADTNTANRVPKPNE